MTIIVHDYTLNQLDSDKRSFIDYLSKFKIFDDDHIVEMKDFETLEDYKTYMRIYNYWTVVFKSLPKVKLDGRIKLGKYTLPKFKTVEFEIDTTGFYLVVLSSERYVNQTIELIYE